MQILVQMNRYFDGKYKISREYSNKYIASIPVYILQIINFNSYLLPRWDRVARNMFWRDNLPVGIEHVCSFIVKLYFLFLSWFHDRHLLQYFLSNSATCFSSYPNCLVWCLCCKCIRTCMIWVWFFGQVKRTDKQ